MNIQELGEGGALRPIDQGPLAEGFDQAIGDHELGGGNGGGFHPAGLQQAGEVEFVPRLEGDELGSEFDDVGGLDFVDHDAIDMGGWDVRGGL